MKPRHRLLGLAALLFASLVQAVTPALAQVQSLGPMQINLATANGGAQSLSLPRGKSAIVDLPVDARDVLVTNPQVADAVLRSPRRIYVMGLAPGVRPTRSSSTPPATASCRSTSGSTRTSAPSPRPSTG